jgi:chromosomal replication initiator protein
MWQTALAELEVTLSKANFRMWFRDTFIAEDTGDTIVIGVPNNFYLTWIHDKHHKHVADTLRKIRPTIRHISYKVAIQQPAAPTDLGELAEAAEAELVATPENQPVVLPAATQQHNVAPTNFSSFETAVSADSAPPIPTGHNPLDPTRTFETFIVGNSNRLAHAVSLAAAAEPGTKYNPLFIYGGVGLGKTHLAQAIGNEIRRQNPGTKVTYVSSETFTNEFIEAIRKRQMEPFKNRYRSSDVLLIDDIQFISGKEGTQEEFFHTFNALHQAKKQIVLTADREPQNIPELEDRLTSRFAWGMVADVQAPDFETRVAILRSKCLEHNYTIPNETVEALAQVIESNIRELEGSLQRLITQGQVENQPLTPEFVAKIFAGAASIQRTKSVNAHRIIQVVSDFFELKSDEVMGARRYKELVYPRQLAMYLMRHELAFSFPKIAKEIGGKDHTTIMHGVKKIEKELSRNTNMQYDINQLKERIHKQL